ncbi:MAG: zeta toxin family protein [Cyanobacteria bacterium J06600_6]
MSEIFVFGGSNGSGKSTIATRFLSSINPSPEFVNADIIAAQLNPDDVDAVAIKASRIMLDRLKVLTNQKVDFAFETTLAARSFARFLRECKEKGYTVNLIYVWLNSPELAISRVAKRVASGGHDIPTDIITRRYQRGLNNLIELYLPLADRWIVYDNSNQRTKIAEKPIFEPIIIYQPDTWQNILSSTNL